MITEHGMVVRKTVDPLSKVHVEVLFRNPDGSKCTCIVVDRIVSTSADELGPFALVIKVDCKDTSEDSDKIVAKRVLSDTSGTAKKECAISPEQGGKRRHSVFSVLRSPAGGGVSEDHHDDVNGGRRRSVTMFSHFGSTSHTNSDVCILEFSLESEDVMQLWLDTISSINKTL